MSFTTYAKYDENLQDIFDQDFDTKYSFKSKAKGPNGTTFTSTSEYKDNKIDGKFGVKWAAPSGFTLDKLEINSAGKITTEVSHAGVVAGLSSEFKSSDKDGSNLNFTYKVPAATVTAKLDVKNLTTGSFSVLSGANDLKVGASVELENKALKGYNFGVGYVVSPKINLAAKAEDKLGKFSTVFSYVVNNDITLAGRATHTKSDKSNSFELATIYACNSNTTMKFKTTSSGVFSASVQQSVDKLSVTGAVQVKKDSLSNPSFGVNLVLG